MTLKDLISKRCHLNQISNSHKHFYWISGLQLSWKKVCLSQFTLWVFISQNSALILCKLMQYISTTEYTWRQIDQLGAERKGEPTLNSKGNSIENADSFVVVTATTTVTLVLLNELRSCKSATVGLAGLAAWQRTILNIVWRPQSDPFSDTTGRGHHYCWLDLSPGVPLHSGRLKATADNGR